MKPQIRGIGIDIVEFQRIRNIKYLGRFAEYFLNQEELRAFSQSPNRTAFIASRFAAKEAVIKAFPGFLRPHDFQITKRGRKPVVTFISPEMEKQFTIFISISHSTDYAAGYATAIAK